MKPRKTLLYILGIRPEKVGGMELFLREFARVLYAAGWHAVLAFEAPPRPEVRAIFEGLEVEFEVLRNQGRHSLEAVLDIARLLGRHRPRVLIYAFNGPLRVYAWVSALLGVRAVIYNDHSSRAIGFVPKRGSALRRMVARILTWPVARSICVSQYVVECAKVDGFLPSGILRMIHNGVDVGRAAAARDAGPAFRSRFNIPADARVVLQVCWMVPEKGVEVLLQAAGRVAAVEPRARFLLVGDGPNRAAYESLARELGLADCVTFTGPILNPTGEGVFAAADIYSQSSQWEEACPLSILEAQSFGVPVVASRVGGIPELLEDGVTGLLVSRSSAEEYAACLLRLLCDDSLRRKMGAAARRRVEANFDLRITAQKYFEEVASLTAVS